ncbi:MAG: hypothetical protein IKN55_11805 [Oscillospiraceae bacterium]|nr:hypothetical protein [Oscillospiraceae bacterium]
MKNKRILAALTAAVCTVGLCGTLTVSAYTVYDQVYDPETGNTWHEGYETNAPLPEPLASAKNIIDRYFKENAIPGEVVVYVQDGVSTLMVLCENSTDEDAVRAFVESSGIDPALIREVGTKAYPAGEDNAPMYKVFDQDALDSWYETNRPLDHDLAGFKSMIEQFMQENGIPGEVGLYTERKTSSIAFSSLVVLCENSKDEEAVRTFLDSAGIVSTLIHSVGTKAYNAAVSVMQNAINRYMTGQNITGYTYVKPDGNLAVICESFDTADQIRRFVDTRDDYDAERIEYGVPTAPAETAFNASTAARVLIAAARIGAGQEPDELEPALDVNGDATLNASDAANILQYAAYVGAGNADIGIRNYIAGEQSMRMNADINAAICIDGQIYECLYEEYTEDSARYEALGPFDEKDAQPAFFEESDVQNHLPEQDGGTNFRGAIRYIKLSQPGTAVVECDISGGLHGWYLFATKDSDK